MRLWLGSSGSMSVISIGFGVGFLDSRCGHPIFHIVQKRMLCNACAANLRDGSWEVLMSSFVFVVRQNPGL